MSTESNNGEKRSIDLFSTCEDGFSLTEDGRAERDLWKKRRRAVKSGDSEKAKKFLVQAWQCLDEGDLELAGHFLNQCDQIHLKWGWAPMRRVYLPE